MRTGDEREEICYEWVKGDRKDRRHGKGRERV